MDSDSYIFKNCKYDIENEIYNNIREDTNNPDEIRNQLSLSHGYPGLIIFFSRTNNEKLVRFLIKRVIQDLNNSSIDLSLFSGLSGVGFSFLYAQQFFSFKTNLVKQINNIIFQNIDDFITNSLNNPNSSGSFDVIQGLSGIGEYLLSVLKSNNDNSIKLINSIRKIVDALELISSNHPNIYKDWWISSDNQFLKEEKSIYFSGNYNLGMAHGMLGPILLFIGLYKENLLNNDDICHLKNWVYELISFNRIYDNKIIFWPRESPKNNIHIPSNHFINRNGWCYGNSIISYVLFYFSKCFNDRKIYKLSISLLKFVINSNNEDLISPIICHGKSGLLMILNKIYSDFYSDNSMLHQISKLKKKIINDYSDSNDYGFVDSSSPIINGYNINQNKVGLLEGTVGILLSLMKKDNNKIPWYTPFILN